MYLIELSANRESFKTVHFKNEIGLNFIVALHKDNTESEKGQTYNAVGKSLIIALIDFCLGSNQKNSFKEYLSGWEFSLKFKINDKEYISKRNTENQNKIVLNGEELSRDTFNDKLECLLFDIPKDISFLSFRTLISFFLRPKKSSYNSFDNPKPFTNPYQIQISNAFLLGLDVFLIQEKLNLKKEKDHVTKLIKELNKDSLLKDFFNGIKDLSLSRDEINEKIVILEKKLSDFKVAKDYYDIKRQADKIKNDIDKIQNEIILVQNYINNIKCSLQNTPDIKRENIEKIYEEASVILNSNALKELSDLEKFYEYLSKNRESRLLNQKSEFEKKLKDLNQKSKDLSDTLDSKMKYLNTHQALDIFVQLTNQLSDYKVEKDKLEQYDKLLAEYRKAKQNLDQKLLDSVKQSDNHLTEASNIINRTKSFFRKLAKRIYPNSTTAGITISNNDKDNQIRFNIDAKIDADASDGINNTKIFCYDLTILLKGFNHEINFLFHDSRLLSDIDPRQVSELFKILSEYISFSNKQYILTLNQNQLNQIKDCLSNDEYYNIIAKNICLELKDELPSDKLLGIQVDMEYNE